MQYIFGLHKYLSITAHIGGKKIEGVKNSIKSTEQCVPKSCEVRSAKSGVR